MTPHEPSLNNAGQPIIGTLNLQLADNTLELQVPSRGKPAAIDRPISEVQLVQDRWLEEPERWDGMS